MPQISYIKYKDILDARRFDAEYFKPEFLLMEQKFELRGWASLKCYCNYIKKGIFDLSPNNYKDIGIPFIRTSEIKDPLIDFSSTVFLNEEIHKLNHKTELKAGDLVFTKIGAYIGDVSLLPRNYSVYNFSQNVTGLSIKHNEIESEFLLIYLLSKYGKKQILRSMMLSGQGKLELEDIRSLKIIDIDKSFREQIQKIVNMVEDLKENSKQLYKEAEGILLNGLGLLNYHTKHSLWFTTTKKEIDQAKRYDSEYYQPKYAEIIKKIASFNPISLADDKYFKIITGTYSKEYLIEGDNYIRSVNINEDLTIGLEEMYKTKEKLDSKYRVKTGDIVTSRVGSIGTLGYISEELNNSFISDNILRIRNVNNDLDNLFLAFYLKKIGSIFMERLQRGSVQQRLNQETLKDIIIPIFKSEIQKLIADKIIESHKLRKESKELLETAKRAVEIAIEDNEETAMEYINTHSI